MADEIDKEITTRKVTSNPNTLGEGHRVSEHQTTRVNRNSNDSGLILGVLLTLALGGGAVAYYLSNRPAPTPVVVPGSNTVIERNNTTIKEVSPAPQQPAPKIEINVPPVTAPPQAATPAPAVKPQTTAPAPTPAVTAQPQTATPPRP